MLSLAPNSSTKPHLTSEAVIWWFRTATRVVQEFEDVCEQTGVTLSRCSSALKSY